MKLKILALTFLLSLSSLGFSNSYWQDTHNDLDRKLKSKPHHRSLVLDDNWLKQELLLAPLEFSGQPPVTIELPLPDGSFVSIDVYESPVLSDELAIAYPDIKTFKVSQTDNPAYTGRLDITSKGFHGMLRTSHGIVYINPENNYNSRADTASYRSFNKSQSSLSSKFSCHTVNHQVASQDYFHLKSAVDRQNKRFGSTIRIYRLAVSATAEYNIAVGDGNKNATLAEIVTAINRVNEIYERDLAIRLKLVSGTSLISSNPNDFSNDNGNRMLFENQEWIDSKLGSDNYDVGHLFSTGGGGLASVGAVCDGDGDGIDEYKAQGVTGLENPVGDVFYVDYVAHELGHQLGATHTFNAAGASAGDCSGNRVGTYWSDNITYLASSAYEPGSGSTIMGYAGLCESQNLQLNSDDYFHGRSIEQIRQLVDGDIAAAEPTLFWADGSICGTVAFTSDSIPNVSAGTDYTIPAYTPFVLTGSATDQDSDESTFLYTWEQYDLGEPTKSLSAMHTDSGSGPLIRSYPGSLIPERYIPTLDAILSGDLEANTGERLPTTDRTIDFKLTLRSGSYGVNQDDMKITVDANACEFKVTKPVTQNTLQGNSFIETTWNVANTNTNPIDCDEVDISYSTDGGLSFPTTLLSNTPNDGIESILLPNQSTSLGRVKVQCSDNIFFNISPDDLDVSSSLTPSGASLSISDSSMITSETTKSANFTFYISRTGDTSGTSSVSYSVTGFGNTPATNDDFPGSTFPEGTVTFSSGEKLKTLDIIATSSLFNDIEKAFSVTLSNASNATINDESGVAKQITDNEQTSSKCKTTNKKTSSGGSGGGSTSFWILGLLIMFAGGKKKER